MRWWVTLSLAVGLAVLFGFAYFTVPADLDQASKDQLLRAARSEADWMALLVAKRFEDSARALEVVVQGAAEGQTASALREQETGVSAAAWVAGLRSQLDPKAEVALVDEAGVVQEASEGGSVLGRPKVVTRALENRTTVGIHRFGATPALIAASPVLRSRKVVGAVVAAIPLDAQMLRRWVPNVPPGAGLAFLDTQGVIAQTLSDRTKWPAVLGLTNGEAYLAERGTRFGALRVQAVAPLRSVGQPTIGSRASVWILLLGVLGFLVPAAALWLMPLTKAERDAGGRTLDLMRSASLPLDVAPIHVPDAKAPSDAKAPAVAPLPPQPTSGPAAPPLPKEMEAEDDPHSEAETFFGDDVVLPAADAHYAGPSSGDIPALDDDPYQQTTVPALAAPHSLYQSPVVVQSQPPPAPPDFEDNIVERSGPTATGSTDDLIAQIKPPPQQHPPALKPPPSYDAPAARPPPGDDGFDHLYGLDAPAGTPGSDAFDAIASAARARPPSPSPSGLSPLGPSPADGMTAHRPPLDIPRDSDLPAPRVDLPAPTHIPAALRGSAAGLALPEPWDAPPPRSRVPSDVASPESVPLPAPVGYRADLPAPKDLSAVPLPPASLRSDDRPGPPAVPKPASPSSAISPVPVPPTSGASQPFGTPHTPGGAPQTAGTPQTSGGWRAAVSNGVVRTGSDAVPLPPGRATPSADAGSGGATPFDESHYRAVYDRFVQAKRELGQPSGSVSWDAFRTKLWTSEQTLLDQHGCRAVRFEVLVRERNVSLRPQLIR